MMRRGGTILVATNNPGKVLDISDLFRELGIRILSGQDVDLPSPPETEDTLIGNARIKAKAAALATGRTVMTDDSGFFIDALNGAPGVHAATWAETPNGRDYDIARRRVWAEVCSAHPDGADLSAHFRTVWLLLTPDGKEHVFTGQVSGTLTWPPRGTGGHDFDSIFVPDGEDRTFAEMTVAEKTAYSSRRGAFEAMKAWVNMEADEEFSTPNIT